MSDPTSSDGLEGLGALRNALVSMGNYSTQIHDISRNLAGNAAAAFDKARDVQGRVDAMDRAVSASLDENRLLLGESARIREVAAFLHNIVDSTHVLGINASILAARAGTAGRGFSVVSQEIRKLAEDSARSLRTIEELVESLQERIRRLAQRNEDSGAAILGQKASLLEVAGYLQGTVLGVDVVFSVSEQSAALAEEYLNQIKTVEAEVRMAQSSCSD